MRNISRAVILTEAGPEVGLGHLGRCVALYDALESLGCACSILVAGEARGYVLDSRVAREQDWYSPQSALKYVGGADIAVIDSYVAAPAVYDRVAEAVPVALYLDDTARLEYPPGIVVNGNPGAAMLGFRRRPGLTQLLGVRYQLLRSEFSDVVPSLVRPNVTRVLVVAGGGEVVAVRDAMAESASTAFPAATLDVVDSPRTASEMRDAMLAADIAISAAGQTLYELAATGTPTVAVCVADNQVAQAQAFEREGALRLGGIWGEDGVGRRLQCLLTELASSEVRAAVSSSARSLVDGAGAGRVARACFAMLHQYRSGEDAT